MLCPKCPSQALRTVRPTDDHGMLSTCPRCSGMWLPRGGEIAPTTTIESTIDPSSHDHDRRPGTCPQGHGLMSRAQTYLGTGFYLDRCPTCHGVWFDHGEWHQVTAAGWSDGLFEIWSASWQQARRREASEASHHQRLRQVLGEDLVERIEALAEELREHDGRSLGVGHLLACLRRPTPSDNETPPPN